MSSEFPSNPNDRHELEASLTALILGELSADQAAALREAMAQDQELSKLYERLKSTIHLVRETATPAAAETPEQSTRLKLSADRREKLLAQFKTVAPKEFAHSQKRKPAFRLRITELAAAIAILAILAAMMLPALSKAKYSAKSVVVLNNLRQLDSAKQLWAEEHHAPPDAVPTPNDLRPYMGGVLPGEGRSVSGETYVIGRVSEAPVAELRKGGKQTRLSLNGGGWKPVANNTAPEMYAMQSKVGNPSELARFAGRTGETPRARLDTPPAPTPSPETLHYRIVLPVADAGESIAKPAITPEPPAIPSTPPLVENPAPISSRGRGGEASDSVANRFGDAQPTKADDLKRTDTDLSRSTEFGLVPNSQTHAELLDTVQAPTPKSDLRSQPNGGAPTSPLAGGRIVLPSDQADGITTSVRGTYFSENAAIGNPEWTGTLNHPETAHSATNAFVGRYAYTAAPTPSTDLYFATKSNEAGFVDPTTGLPIGQTIGSAVDPTTGLPVQSPPAANNLGNSGSEAATASLQGLSHFGWATASESETTEVNRLAKKAPDASQAVAPAIVPPGDQSVSLAELGSPAKPTLVGKPEMETRTSQLNADAVRRLEHIPGGTGGGGSGGAGGFLGAGVPGSSQPTQQAASETELAGTLPTLALNEKAGDASILRDLNADDSQKSPQSVQSSGRAAAAFGPAPTTENRRSKGVQITRLPSAEVPMLTPTPPSSIPDSAPIALSFTTGAQPATASLGDQPEGKDAVAAEKNAVTGFSTNSFAFYDANENLGETMVARKTIVSEENQAVDFNAAVNQKLSESNKETLGRFYTGVTRGDLSGLNDQLSVTNTVAANNIFNYQLGTPESAEAKTVARNELTTTGQALEEASRVLKLESQDRHSVKQGVELQMAKEDLEQIEKSRGALALRARQENIEKALPKTMSLSLVDPAEAQPDQKPALGQRIKQAVTGKVERFARVKVERDVTDVSAANGQMGYGAIVQDASQPAYDPHFVATESEVIQSEPVLDKAIEKLKLNEAWAGKDGARLTMPETRALLKKRIELRPVPNTGLMEIGAKSGSSEEAAKIANAVAESYAEHRAEQRRELTSNGIKEFEGKLVEYDQKVAQARQRVAELEKNSSEQPIATPTPAKDADLPLRRPAASAAEPQPEVQTTSNAFSTFSMNVSDVSLKLAAASLEKGVMPDAASVRSEEFLNAFDYRDPEPPEGVPVGFAWERAQYPFAQNRDLLRFSIKTAAQGRQAGCPMNIVLLLDNSGSMERADRVRIIHEALRVLAGQLQPQDKLSVVVFARTARLLVDGVAGDQAAQVAEEVSGLTPQGGTNLEEAMNLAYQTALRHYLARGVNRVVLLTDGAANLGNVEPEALKQKVEVNRKQGVALDCFGIGWEGFNDDLLEVLSSHGDGRYAFLNTPEDAATDFAGKLAGALNVAAADVKVQVEFNPKRVNAYRQIGYAKHQLTKEQFRDNTVDAAEIAAAESGNALYVVEVNPRGEGPLATVRVRYKVPGTTDYPEHAWEVPFAGNATTLEQSSPAMRLAATASAFSEWLVSSPYAVEVTPDRLLGLLSGVPEIYGADERPKKLEWMIRQAKSIEGK